MSFIPDKIELSDQNVKDAVRDWLKANVMRDGLDPKVESVERVEDRGYSSQAVWKVTLKDGAPQA